MNFSKGAFLVVMVAFCAAVGASDDSQKIDSSENAVDRNTVTTPQQTGSDLTIPGNIVNILTNGGAVVAGFLAVAAVVMLVAPGLSTKLSCALVGCDGVYQGYSAPNGGVYADYNQQYGQGGTFNNPTYQKRSVEYIAPVLKALGNAYEKYNTAATAKKVA